MTNIIKSSKHETKFSNADKLEKLGCLIDESRRVIQLMVDDIWINGYEWVDTSTGEVKKFSVSENQLEFPKYIDYKRFGIETTLTARMLSSLATQVCGIIKASTEKQRKRLYTFHKRKCSGESKVRLENLIKKIKQNIPQKPNCSRINIEVSSKCSDWEESSEHFWGYLRLKSVFGDRTEIKIPIKRHRHSKKLESKGTMMTSFLISKKYVNIRWKIEKPETKQDGEILGCDQGFKDVATFSNGTTTPKQDIHGHTLESILRSMSRKKKGSKAMKRAQAHRTNYVNWSINQMDFSDVGEVRLEEIHNIGYRTKQSRLMSHWTNTTIRDKIESKCEEEGIRLIHQSSTYRSQRCSCCGVVRKANRKGKIYKCKHCSLEIDADLNASLNHVANLPEIPYTLRELKLNRGDGFLWLETGFYDFSTGRSLESLPHVEE